MSASLTGLDRVELMMAYAFAERANGWPVGPEVSGPAYSCPAPTVQIVPLPRIKGTRLVRRYVVHTLFPFRYTDQRYPPSPPLTLHNARRCAYRRLWMLAGSGKVQLGQGPGIDLSRGGKHIGLEVALS